MFEHKKKNMSEMEKKAKKGVLSDIMKEMSGMMAEPMKGLKKVTVAAKDQEGLEKGLDKAKEMLQGEEEESCPECEKMLEGSCPECSKSDEEESSEEPSEEMSEESMGEEEHQSIEELEKQIKKLEELKRKKLGM